MFPKHSIDLKIEKNNNGSYSACLNTKDYSEPLFCGRGKTLAEAIGACLISNRERLKFTFEIKDGDQISRSTEYGKRRKETSDNKTYEIERIDALLFELAEFDSHQLKDIILTQNGEPIPIPSETIDEFRFVGLCNHSFVEMRYWEEVSEEISEEDQDDW